MLDLSDQLDSSASQDKDSHKDSHLFSHQHWSSPIPVPQQLMSTSPDIIETPPDNHPTQHQPHHRSNCDRVLIEEGCVSISPNGNMCVISSPAKTSTALPLKDFKVQRTDFEESMDREEVSVPTETTIVPMSLRYLPCKVMNHPAFHSIHLQQAEDPITGRPKLRSVVVLNSKITKNAFTSVLWFLYTGSLSPEKCANLSDVITAASLLDLADVVAAIANIKHQEEYMNLEITEAFLERRRDRFRELFADKGFLSGNSSFYKIDWMLRLESVL